MKKIISLLIMFLLLFNVFSVNAYNVSEGTKIINGVITKLEGSDFSFKYNEGSSAYASYYVLYNGNMIGYIYTTKDGITLGDGWDYNGEFGTFYNQGDLGVEEIVARFYTDKKPLGESVANDFNIGDLQGLALDPFDIINSTSLDKNINSTDLVDKNFSDNSIDKNKINNLDKINRNNIDNSKNENEINNKITYQDGLDIIKDTDIKLKKIDDNIKDESLYEKMITYRKMWNNIKNEDEKNIGGKEGLRIKYLHKKIEEKYKEIFKEYVLSNHKNNYSNSNLIKSDTIINNDAIIAKDINKNTVNTKDDGYNNESTTYNDKTLINDDNFKLSNDLLENFKKLYYLLDKKYNNGNISLKEKNKMNELFNKVDKNNSFASIDNYLSNNPDFLNNEYNIDLLQKLMIIMCSK